MWRSVPFRDSCGRVVPWGYVFLTDGPTAEEVADLFQQAFGRRAVIVAANPITAKWPSSEKKEAEWQAVKNRTALRKGQPRLDR